jgi:hypothetical protein
VAEWGLCEIISTEKCEEPLASLRKIKILSHKNKDEWELIPKYHIGRKPPKEE